MKTINDLKQDDLAIITEVKDSCNIIQQLASMGVLPQTELRVVAVAPMGDPITIEALGQRISIRRLDAKEIYVETLG